MMYFGGKERISKELSAYLNNQLKEGQPFVDLFCGSCNVISKIDPDRVRIANDKHIYLIAMWEALQEGWVPPKSLNLEEYQYTKDHLAEQKYLSGFVGFGCSFSGKWFGGYASSGDRNYCLNAYNSTMKKLQNLKEVQFFNKDYRELPLPEHSLIYCDIPYKGTTAYSAKEVGAFDHEAFYHWVEVQSSSHDIYISEYERNVPKGFEVVWAKESKQDMHNKTGIKAQTVEVLIKR